MRKNRRKYKPAAQVVPNQARIVTRKLSHRRVIDVSKTWYVVKTGGGYSERRAEAGLRSSGFDVYRPHEDRWRIYRRRCSDVSIGWFRGYIFVGVTGAPRFDIIRDTDGVSSVLGVSGTPLSVPGELLQRVADELSGIRVRKEVPFSEGGRVLLKRGPFADLMGIVRELDNEGERALIEIDMLGKSHHLELSFDSFKVA